MDHFAYRDRVLHCEDVAVPELAEQYAQKLRVKYPKRSGLVAELKKQLKSDL